MAVEPLFDSLGSIAVSSHARLRHASALLSTNDKSPLEHGPMRPTIIEIPEDEENSQPMQRNTDLIKASRFDRAAWFGEKQR